jgi:hypothetical protein
VNGKTIADDNIAAYILWYIMSVLQTKYWLESLDLFIIKARLVSEQIPILYDACIIYSFTFVLPLEIRTICNTIARQACFQIYQNNIARSIKCISIVYLSNMIFPHIIMLLTYDYFISTYILQNALRNREMLSSHFKRFCLYILPVQFYN